MNSKQKGFSALVILLLLVIVGIITLTGWYVWNAKQNSEKTLSQTNNSDIAIQSKKPVETTSKKATLKEYENDEYGISFSYPEDWTFKEQLKDIGRGQNEGDVTVTSPYGTKVNFNLNLGGKGGACIDENGQQTTRYCLTREYLKVEKLPESADVKNLYLYHAAVTDSEINGGKTTYTIGITTDDYAAPVVGAELIPIFVMNLYSKPGNTTITVSGSDDVKKGSPAYFETQQAKEAAAILKSVKVRKSVTGN